MNLLPTQIIRLKRDGKVLPAPVLRQWIQEYGKGHIPDYQMSAFLMAVCLRGFSSEELHASVEAMIESGVTLHWPKHPRFLVDKHSTGGIGDKTSLILGPIVAAAGLSVPMMSGRGLGHTGGTLDKLESIPGFQTRLELPSFQEQVEKLNIAFIGQTEEICPADRKLYSLRDVTGTVESMNLISGSIMSKKIAEGIQGLVLDVKFGTGAFFKTLEESAELARQLMAIGHQFGKKVVALVTDMNQPLGRFAGNALEVHECIDILTGQVHRNSHQEDSYADTRELSIQLAAQMMNLSGRWGNLAAAEQEARHVLNSGQAYNKFVEICRAQGGDLTRLPRPRHSRIVPVTVDGFITGFDLEAIGYLNVQLGAGRVQLTDVIDPTAGIEFHHKLGHAVRRGEPLMTLYAADEKRLHQVAEKVGACVSYGQQAPPKFSLIRKVMS
ncbi:MAG: thymidine phosphorylase [Bdellovibrio sp.]|nr:MAG: thymidine phosphorylase [Bdellovibrio sp.]